MVSIEACYNDSGVSISTVTCQSNVTAMIQMAQRSGARVTLWVPTFSCTPATDSAIAPYRTVIRNLASTYSTYLFDTYNDFVALPAERARKGTHFPFTPFSPRSATEQGRRQRE